MTVDAQAASDLHRIGVGLNKGGWAHHDFKGSDIDQWHDPNDCRICAAKDALAALAARLEAAETELGETREALHRCRADMHAKVIALQRRLAARSGEHG